MQDIEIYTPQAQTIAPQSSQVPQAVATIGPELSAKWVEFLDAKPKTIATYTRAIKQFISYLGSHGITQPTRADILAYREHLVETHKATTVRAYMAAVKLFFRWLSVEGLYGNVADHVKSVKIEQGHKKDYLTSKQVKRLLEGIDRSTLKGKRDYALLLLMVSAGLRTVEASRACVEDLRTVADYSVLYVQGKGRSEKAEYVKVPEVTEVALREYLAARGSNTGPLFSSLSNNAKGGTEPMDTRSISRVAKERLLEAGFNSDRLTAHSLRHTAATLSLLNGASVPETMQMLRHKNISTTMIYNHALERAKNNSEERIVKAIFG